MSLDVGHTPFGGLGLASDSTTVVGYLAFVWDLTRGAMYGHVTSLGSRTRNHCRANVISSTVRAHYFASQRIFSGTVPGARLHNNKRNC